MSEWRGLTRPERHAPTSVTDMAWCNVCDGPCYSPEACCCCLAAEVKRLTALLESLRETRHRDGEYPWHCAVCAAVHALPAPGGAA